ncbi:MAG: 50S ribosomal protein L22 [Verrucomicrobiae bacterium]|nr:50S ribosomal protein L22 [Verrucomicrobiae bacterium]
MEVRAIHRNARISSRKAWEVAKEIQGLPALEALDIMKFSTKKAARLIYNVLKSAVANAEHNNNVDPTRLIIKESVVGQGATMRRWRPKARGSAGMIRKRTSHIKIILTDGVETPAA